MSGAHPHSHVMGYQLRYLQTLSEMAAEQNSTLVIPIPVEMLKAFTAALGGGRGSEVGSGLGVAAPVK